MENSGFLGCVIFLNYELTRSVTILFSRRDLFAKSHRDGYGTARCTTGPEDRHTH